jgi:hypothetical protein
LHRYAVHADVWKQHCGFVAAFRADTAVNPVSDLSPLSGLVNLQTLYISSNTSITNIGPLSGLINLTSLEMSGTRPASLSPLQNLTKLTFLNLYDCGISDISAVQNLTELTWLNVGQNTVSNISAVAGMTKLTWLGLHNNSLTTDISALVTNAATPGGGIGSATTVLLNGNILSGAALTDVGILRAVPYNVTVTYL